jgi:chromosome segregation ATPase
VTDNDLIAHRLNELHQDVAELKTALLAVSAAITKLALVEERQTQASASLGRAFDLLEKLEGRIAKLEQAQPEQARAAIWIDRGLTAAATAAVVYVAKHSGLLG